ncbi:uncharacterized protein LOC124401350 isoform X14 [Silurus meridionalis]|uniref:uncharacterized protein LOC124401350 isoform X14 n=1 Tax=Silurus meridionalis TaxID=175797 RepID=UPI001EEA31ED|nr:uncharacterized protein LOC124401350 isoform X14 [Silurus meridionalis]
MMKLRRSSTNEEEGNQSGKRSERDQRRGGELCNGGRLLPVPAEVTHRSEEERETEPGRERERERERVTAEASQSLEQQPDGRLSIWRRAREAQTECDILMNVLFSTLCTCMWMMHTNETCHTSTNTPAPCPSHTHRSECRHSPGVSRSLLKVGSKCA